jgi:gliding motility-associated-like protein
VDIIFKAFDPSANESNPILVSFKINDESVIIKSQPDFNIIRSCTTGIQDSLNNWIKRLGNAVATDACGRPVLFRNFIYNTNLGAAGTGDILMGPYPTIPNNACNWAMDISFFVVDSCGNPRAFTGRYRIRDDVTPVIDLVSDITVSCSNLPDNSIKVSDACDKNPDILYSFSSTKGLDSTKCDFYNYVMQRQWVVTDKCGNSVIGRQRVVVVDKDKPTIVFDSPKIVTCEEVRDTFKHLNLLLDNCAKPIVTFTDSIIGNSCAYSIFRKYTIRDYCGNETVKIQQLLVSDTKQPIVLTKPENLIIDCLETIQGIKSRFDEWINKNGGLTVVDNCSNVKFFTLLRGRYKLNDTLSYLRATPNLDSLLLNSKAARYFSVIDSIDFIASDACGNSIISMATFALKDTLPPFFTKCNDTLQYDVLGKTCSRLVKFPSPLSNDLCSTSKAQIYYSLNQEPFTLSTADSLQFNLNDAINLVTFKAIDKAGNESLCFKNIILTDKQPPVIICGKDTTIFVNNCNVNVLPLKSLQINDNCSPPITLDTIYPSRFIAFSSPLDNLGNRTDTISYALNGLSKIRLADKDINVTLNLNSRFISNKGSVRVLLPNGNVLIPITQILSSDTFCRQYVFNSKISKDVFNSLVTSNGTLSLRIITTGLMPCKDLKSSNLDSISNYQFKVKAFDYELIKTYQLNNDIKRNFNIDSLLNLGIGKYLFEVSTKDQSNNTGNCAFVLTVRDTIKPTLVCRSLSPIISFKSNLNKEFNLTMVDSIIQDNCGIDSTWLKVGNITCLSGRRSQELTLNTIDKSGNSSFCITKVEVLAPILKPTFVTGLCGNDTLRLFHNISSSFLDSTVTFRWLLRDSVISTNPNPTFIGRLSLFNETITLEVKTKEGCLYTESLRTFQDANAKPSLKLIDIACKNRGIVLLASEFVQKSIYNWYEGVYPNGILRSSTEIPTYSFKSMVDSVSYYVIVDGGICKSNPSDQLKVYLTDTPKVTGQDTMLNICEGQSLILRGSNVNTLQKSFWNGPNGFISILINPLVSTNTTQVNGGVYSFKIELNGCISDSVITKVNVLAKPNKPIITGDSLNCLGSSITLSSTGVGDTVIWLKNGVVVSRGVSKTFKIEKSQSIDNGSYTAVFKTAQCSSEISNAININVSNQVTLAIVNPGEVCSGDSVTLIATPFSGFNYTWTGPNGFQSSGSSILFKPTAGIYNVTAKSQSGCQSMSSTEVKIKPRPSILDLTSDFNPCVEPSKDITLSATLDQPIVGTTFSWIGPNGFASTAQKPKIINNSSNIFGSYRLIVQSNGCISEPKMIEIKSAPVLSKLVIKGKQVACQGDSITLTTQKGYTSYEWATPYGPVTTIDSMLVIRSFSGQSVGAYTVKAKANQCEPPASDPFNINVAVRPQAPIIQGKVAVCLGDSVILTSNVIDTALTYFWHLPKNKIVTSKSRLSIIDLPNELNGSYKLQTQNGACKSEFSNTLELAYKAPIPIPKLPSTLISLCDKGNSEVQICLQNIPKDNALTYFLIQLPSNKVLLSTKDSCITFLSSEVELGSNKIRLTSKKDECFSDSFDDALFSSVKEPKIKAQIIANTIGVCAKEQRVTLSNKSSIDTVFYVWKVFNRGNTLANLPNNSIEVSNFLPGTNIVTLSLNFNACRDISSDTINLFLGTKPIARPDTFKISVNEKTPFNVLVNDSVGPFPVLKFSNQQFYKIEYDSLVRSFVFAPDRNFIGQVKVDYELCFGSCKDFCTNSSVVFNVEGSIDCIFPTIITPNGDGINDNFEVPCIPIAGQNESSLKVFNIHGDQVYGAQPYLNDWSGTSKGTNLIEGTYYYIFQLDKKAEVKKSFLIIQR